MAEGEDARITELVHQNADLTCEREFWCSFARELVTAMVRRRGTDTARRYVEHACAFARRDFPNDPVTSDAVDMLLVEALRLSRIYATSGSFAAHAEATARGEERGGG